MTKRQITQLSYEITGFAIKVHRTLGAGLLESVYEKCLVHELIKNGYEVRQQVKVPISYEEIIIDADLKISKLTCS